MLAQGERGRKEPLPISLVPAPASLVPQGFPSSKVTGLILTGPHLLTCPSLNQPQWPRKEKALIGQASNTYLSLNPSKWPGIDRQGSDWLGLGHVPIPS